MSNVWDVDIQFTQSVDHNGKMCLCDVLVWIEITYNNLVLYVLFRICVQVVNYVGSLSSVDLMLKSHNIRWFK
jgi:hypothetical protein